MISANVVKIIPEPHHIAYALVNEYLVKTFGKT